MITPEEIEAQERLTALRWPNGVTCPHCGSKKMTKLENRRAWECHTQHKRQQFSIRTGTVLEDSRISIEKWLTFLQLIVKDPNITANEAAKVLQVTQKTAWLLKKRVRQKIAAGANTLEKLIAP